MSSDAEYLAYFAGFFDGEGSIGIYTNGNTAAGRTLRVQLTQNIDPIATSILTEAADRWHASMTIMNRTMKRPAYNWQNSGANAYATLLDLRPWLRIKLAQADVAIEWWRGRAPRQRDALGRMRPISALTVARDIKYAALLKQLKRSDLEEGRVA